MAEDKKSFILYADLLYTVNKMSNDKAGVLFKTILEYVNDNNPQVEDLLVDLVFEPIKQQLKRDLKNYEGVKKERSTSGRMGNLKRWNLDLHQQVLDNKVTLEQAEDVAKNRIAINSDSDSIAIIANVAVNGNVNGTVTVNDNDTIELQKIKKKFTVSTLSEFQSVKLSGMVKAFFLDFYATNNKTEYYYQAKDGAKIHGILKKVVFKMTEKKNKQDFTLEEILDATKLIISASANLGDNFINNNFNLSIIDSKFNEIYTSLVNGKSRSSKTKHQSIFAS
jgi:hypothetical protein